MGGNPQLGPISAHVTWLCSIPTMADKSLRHQRLQSRSISIVLRKSAAPISV